MSLLAVITGGGTGIGRAQALALNKELGATVILTGRRKEPLERTQQEIGLDKCHIVADCDIGEIASWKKIATLVEEIGGGELHFLGNTACAADPIIPLPGFEACAAEDIIRYNNTYITGVHLSYHFLAPFLIQGAEKRGRPSVVINMSSTNSTLPRGMAHMTPFYHTCKVATDAITRTAYGLYKDKNVLSYAICPFFYDTDMARMGSAMMGMTLDQISAWFNPLPAAGDPSDIGQITAALLTGTASSGIESGCAYLIMPLPPELSSSAASSILFSGTALNGNLQDSLDLSGHYVAWTKLPQHATFYSNGKEVPEEDLNKICAAMEVNRLEKLQASSSSSSSSGEQQQQ